MKARKITQRITEWVREVARDPEAVVLVEQASDATRITLQTAANEPRLFSLAGAADSLQFVHIAQAMLDLGPSCSSRHLHD